MKSLASFFLAFVFSLNAYANIVSQKEKDALIKLYHPTTGSHWKQNGIYHFLYQTGTELQLKRKSNWCEFVG